MFRDILLTRGYLERVIRVIITVNITYHVSKCEYWVIRAIRVIRVIRVIKHFT